MLINSSDENGYVSFVISICAFVRCKLISLLYVIRGNSNHFVKLRHDFKVMNVSISFRTIYVFNVRNRKCQRSPVAPTQHFSCAAQQLNASQSTHRFSFVNHTIKTVNMPKVRHSVNLKSKLTSYISEFKEDGLSTDNKILFCNLCQCAVSSTQKFLVQQHITTSKHQANKQLNSKQRQLFLTQPTTSNVRSEFNIDLCRSLISADIPLYKLKNKVFREFLEKYTQHTIPDESTLRKTYAPSIYDETIQKIRDEIKDSSIWVSIDETPDKEGRLVGNVVIGLLSEQYSERILLHCDVLEKCNNKTIVKLFNEAMGILWPKGIIEKVFLKAPSRVNVLKEMYPEIPLPPKPILTRWGTWLEAVEYYAEHIDSINNVLLALDSEDAVSIDTAKTVTCDISVKNDLAHIQHTFSCIIKTLKSLQNRHLSLSESFEIINSTVEQLNRGRGKVADAVRAKVDTVLSKIPGYEELQKVVAVMSGESTVKINLDLSPADIVKLNYVPVTSCDVERSFSQYKSILRDNRRRFTFQHLKEMFVTYCYAQYNVDCPMPSRQEGEKLERSCKFVFFIRVPLLYITQEVTRPKRLIIVYAGLEIHIYSNFSLIRTVGKAWPMKSRECRTTKRTDDIATDHREFTVHDSSIITVSVTNIVNINQNPKSVS
ncbi:hypothetical protein ANN_06984 [Periplaneta americana]|uniref:DUF659 domain-containing protein n=1 Tax=Periplaneta americana TaxID=6978 RepID=A0ABQ8TF02_PERAM|nr:hypothetical protein ANN_06984 [Periplaneta americana]